MYYFRELIHVLYLMKQLHDMGRFEIVEHLSEWELTDGEDFDFDLHQEAAYSAIRGIFKSCHDKSDYDDYYDCYEIMSFSDKVITDYYRLAGVYGKREKIKRKDNPYLKDARMEARRHFEFSYCLDWRIQSYTNPKYSHQSRLGILIDYNGEVDIIGVAIGLADMYRFFTEKCEELRKHLSQGKRLNRKRSGIAAARPAKRKGKKARRPKRAAFRSPRRAAKRAGKKRNVQKLYAFANAEQSEQREAIAA